MTEARGSNMHHMRGFVQRDFGRAGWARVLEVMGEADATVLRGLLPVGWYALALQHRLLRTIDETLGKGDRALVEQIGCYEAQQDLTVVHRLFLKMASPAFALRSAGRYWGRFYTSGTWDVTRESPNEASARLRGLDPFDPLMELYLRAYIQEMWTLMGATLVDTRSHVEDEVIHIAGRWR